VDALRAWLRHRGDHPGALFCNLDRAHRGERLTGRGLHQLVGGLGARAGLGAVRPHALRHAGITAALDASNGDVRACARFSRHRDVRVLQRYDDAREDIGGSIARLVAAQVGS
jgi:integrase/recombinase XerC